MTATEETAMVRSAMELLADSRAIVEPALRSAVEQLPPSTRRVVGYQFGWCDERGEPVNYGGGKALRPTLVLLCAEAAGGASAAVPAAVAVELVHNSSLLHDDVMDRGLTRRHRATAWTVFGVNAAITAGDALMTLAFDVLAAAGHPAMREGMRMLAAATQDLLDGQNADLAFERRLDVDLSACLGMSARKTGALLACACALGARYGGGTDGQVEALRGFGERLGLAFQLVDDLLGIWGDPALTGKPVFSDLHNRKKSLPVVAALTSGTAAGRELGTLYGREAPLNGTELVRAAELIEDAGGRAWSEAMADDLAAAAVRQLASAGANARTVAELTALARLAARRIR